MLSEKFESDMLGKSIQAEGEEFYIKFNNKISNWYLLEGGMLIFMM